jgi:2'-5' RNA ligase
VTRLFVALRLPEPVLDAIAQRLAPLTLPGRRTTRAQWHLTLQFLGDDADPHAVSDALAGIDTAGGYARLGGPGTFPDVRHARVLWLGLTQGNSDVTRLAAAVAHRVAGLGHEPDPRPFRAHITVTRVRVPTDLRAEIASIDDTPVGPTWAIDALTLYESRRHSSGADYIPRATIPLPGGPLSA